ncbi:glycoside hydrolase family 19 protein [Variovorax boronicumulans]
MDANTLARCTGSTPGAAALYAGHLTVQMERFEIDTRARTAAFLANVSAETQRLAAVEEDLNYRTADRLRLIFPSLFVAAKGGKHRAEDYVRRPAALSELRYRGYHGRGLLHLTWLDAYAAAGAALGFDYVGKPSLVSLPEHAAATACWFWAEFKKLNPAADRGDMYEIRGKVNGPARLQLAETMSLRTTALRVLGAD